MIDYGPGISPERMSQVFESFFTTKSHGMGLGLSISRSIVEAHGGRIWLDVDRRDGATFYFSVPRTVFAASPGLAEAVDSPAVVQADGHAMP